MSYQIYRNTTLGHALQESLDELQQSGQINPQIKYKVLAQFDKAINNALASRVRSRINFRAGHLNTYRFCDNVWTFLLNDVEFREMSELFKVSKVKIVACDGKAKSSSAHNILSSNEAIVEEDANNKKDKAESLSRPYLNEEYGYRQTSVITATPKAES